jgi:hypothetical protein
MLEAIYKTSKGKVKVNINILLIELLLLLKCMCLPKIDLATLKDSSFCMKNSKVFWCVCIVIWKIYKKSTLRAPSSDCRKRRS